MLDYLIERENDEMFRTSTRTLSFPDGRERRVEAYRLVWRWFDRSIAYEFGFDEETILRLTEKCEAEENLPVGQALGRVLNYFIGNLEAAGMDFTDDNLALSLGRERLQRLHARKTADRGAS